MKGLIVYKGKYGATRQYAEWLGQELNLPVMTTSETSKAIAELLDYVIIGGSVYMGKWQPADWARGVIDILKNKKTFCFIVCATGMHEHEKLHEISLKNISGDWCVDEHVHFLPGRLIKKALSFTDMLLLHLGSWLQKDAAEAKRMLQDFDGVKKKSLEPIVKDVLSIVPQTTVSTL